MHGGRTIVIRALVLVALAIVPGLRAGEAAAAEPAPPTLDEAIAIAGRLARAGGQGQAALAAWADRLATIPPAAIVPCLPAFADATPAGANWLRSGLDRAVEAAGDRLSEADVEAFVGDRTRPHRGRVLAFTWLRERDGGRAEAVLAGLLDDPVADLRYEAVELSLAADGADEAARIQAHRRGLAAARDVAQVERIAAWLGEHGEPVDLAAVFGFVRRWRVSGAFDNVGGRGFATAYPPEAGPKSPDTSAWKEVVTTDKHGAVDLNAAVATKKGVLAYAVAQVSMPRGGPAEVRLGSPCAVTVWVNGAAVMTHEIYHASEAIDQYVATADFRAGDNTVLVKCCQNEQTEPWAVDWKFQLRICDAEGTPLAIQPQP